MSLSVGAGSSWTTHAALMQLRSRQSQLQADHAAGAQQQVLTADVTALRVSAQQAARLRPGHRLDITM